MYDEQTDLVRILESNELSPETVKFLMRFARYSNNEDMLIDYANTCLPESGDYLRPHHLTALVRADISEEEAVRHLERNRVFFARLAELLPSILRFFKKAEWTLNPKGLLSQIDDCHNDFHATAESSRRDRQLRETKEKLISASRLTNDAAAALEDAKTHFEIEFCRYRAAYYPYSDLEPLRFLSDLIRELKMCSGVLEIMNAAADKNPRKLFIFGNDTRSTIVEWVYHMCTMWGGPKLVTTPGSDFSLLCGLLFEAITGKPDESLAGAINRYARSEERKEWDEGEEEGEDDNFLSQKNTMKRSAREINNCRILLDDSNLSEIARTLLKMRIVHEKNEFEKASNAYGPHQVLISQMNEDQFLSLVAQAVSRWSPERIAELDESLLRGQTRAESDIELGKIRRAARASDVDV